VNEPYKQASLHQETTMKIDSKNKWRKILLLLACSIIIKIISFFPGFIEAFYSTGIYPYLATFFRILTCSMPFSFGDIFYAAITIWLIISIFRFFKKRLKKQLGKEKLIDGLRKIIQIVLIIYIFFNIAWGLNYNRLGISYQLQIEPQKYTADDLKDLTKVLIDSVNNSRKRMDDSVTYPSNKFFFKDAVSAYDKAKKQYPFLNYRIASVKSSMYGNIGNYLGFLGYYNPFTGEAQVNTTMPRFVIPYTTCHEMAHQLGYGDEDEANFVGYLSAKSSSNPMFHYSVYFDLYLYANSALFMRDSLAARNNYKQLDTLVKQDIIAYRKFLRSHTNPVEPIIRIFYGEYLKANNQPKGIDTYDEVVAWLMAYRKKYGAI
jgi:hypothetical protein